MRLKKVVKKLFVIYRRLVADDVVVLDTCRHLLFGLFNLNDALETVLKKKTKAKENTK